MSLKNTIRKHLLEQTSKEWKKTHWWIPSFCKSNTITPPSSTPILFTPGSKMYFSSKIPETHKYLDPKLINKLKILADKWDGEPLKIISAGRPNIGGGAKCSQHFVGKAVDIAIKPSTKENALKLAKLASSIGFNGIGIYRGNTVHIDVRDWLSAWGPGFGREDVLGWAKTTLDAHMRGEYLNKDLADLEVDTTPEKDNQGFFASVKSKVEDKLKKMNAPEDSLEELVNLVLKAIFKA